MRRIFETSIERIGRIIAAQYDINVVFEGSLVATDGKTIYLPSTADLTDELIADMHGFLDHEVSHCRYTTFPEISKVLTGRGGRFHKELLNSVEDARIERLMVVDYPGCRLNLEPLNKKLRGKLKDGWAKIPWPVRLICTIRDVMDDETDAAVDDKDTKPFLDLLAPDIALLNGAKSTEDLRLITEAMTQKILEHLDEETEKKLGKSDLKEGSDDKKDAKASGDGAKDKESAGKGTGKKAAAAGKLEKEVASGEEAAGDAGGPGDAMMEARAGKEADADKKGASPWNDHDLSVDDMVRRDVKACLGDETPTKRDVSPLPPEAKAYGGTPDGDRTRSNAPHVPFSRRFDKERDFSGKGSTERYARLKLKVAPHVGAIKRTLERKLKVAAQAKWKGDRERGSIDTRSLARLVSDKGFIRPFKEMTKKDVTNVAVQILIDQSGSMSGEKIETAKMTAIALAEALTSLRIAFEVTGFYSIIDTHLAALPAAREANAKRFNRRVERLEKHIFKSFDTNSLVGIERVETGAQNPDGEAVRWAADRLAVQKQKRKILIVLSDGEPSTGEGDRRILRGDLYNAVRKIMKAGIEVIGFGIQTRSVQEFYPDSLVINSLDDLPVRAMTKLASLLGG